MVKFIVGFLGLITTGAGTGTAIVKGDSIETKHAVTATRVEALQADAGEVHAHLKEHDQMLQLLDRRTTYMKAQGDLVLDRLGVPASKRPIDSGDK